MRAPTHESHTNRRTGIRGDYRVYTFDDFTSFLAELQPDPDLSSHHVYSGSDPWAGTATYREALDLARKGWPEGMAQVRPIVDRVLQDALRWAQQPEDGPSIEGDYFDPGLVAQGIPECCYAPDEESQRLAYLPSIKLALNVSMSSAVSAETIRKRGAAFLALVQTLEALGVKNELWLTETACGHEVRILVKGMGDMLQWDKACYLFMHPSVLRRLVFAAQETMGEPEAASGTYGRPEDSFIDADFTLQGNEAALLNNTPVEDLDRWVLAHIERFIKGDTK